MASNMHSATMSSGSNIAVIKYWGKDNVALNTPLNSSLSVAISQDDMRTVTSAASSPSFTRDRLWLNGEEQKVGGSETHNKRVVKVLDEIRKKARAANVSSPNPDHFIHMASYNNFPTAAGLASSAAGYACMVAALARLFKIDNLDSSSSTSASYPAFLSAIARQGSGSACRSMYGGFVKWQKGNGGAAGYDGSDSHAIQVEERAHWPDLDMLILVANAKKKKVSSSSGMQTTAATSPLLAHRAQNIVAPRLAEMEKACKERDFDTFARLTMMDSNQFHATCLDTYPPIFYLSEVSHAVIALVHAYNQWSEAEGEGGKGSSGARKHLRATYTFDAGPNAVLFARKEHIHQLLALVLYFFPPNAASQSPFVNHAHLQEEIQQKGGASALLPAGLISIATAALGEKGCNKGQVKRVIHTGIGEGPQVLPEQESLLDSKSGLPFSTGKSAAAEVSSLSKLLVAGSFVGLAVLFARSSK